MKKPAAIFVAIVLAAFGVAACGDDDDDGETTATQEQTETQADTGAAGGGKPAAELKLSAPADGSFAYDKTSLTSGPGAVTITFDNPATLSHDVTLEDSAGEEVAATDLIAQDEASFTATLKPGTYTYYCSVPGHREGGMEGEITVK